MKNEVAEYTLTNNNNKKVEEAKSKEKTTNAVSSKGLNNGQLLNIFVQYNVGVHSKSSLKETARSPPPSLSRIFDKVISLKNEMKRMQKNGPHQHYINNNTIKTPTISMCKGSKK